jgi:hypothetical protein
MAMTDIELLRHALATLAYRAAKTMRGAPPEFATFRPGPTSTTPVLIVSHMGDLFDWASSMALGEPKWSTSAGQDWEHECSRFFAARSINGE